MRWDDFRRSDNVDDVRGGGGGFGLPGGRGGLGIGTVIVLGIVGWALGIDPRLLIGGAEILTGGAPQHEAPGRTGPARTGAPSDPMGQFVAAVLGDTEDRWKAIFRQGGQTYREPRLVLFERAAGAGSCGMAQSAMGPFYCPPDGRIYLDTSFFRDLQTRFGACGRDGGSTCEFAQAYVIAHEVGHHVQNLMGILPKAEQAKRSVGRGEANRIQVRVELQADCFAGLWAHHSQQKWKFLEPGDIDAAMRTAAAIGDDRLQQQSQGRVVPDSFTHGSSAQRQRWFMTGLKEGKVSSCNTFNAAQL